MIYIKHHKQRNARKEANDEWVVQDYQQGNAFQTYKFVISPPSFYQFWWHLGSQLWAKSVIVRTEILKQKKSNSFYRFFLWHFLYPPTESMQLNSCRHDGYYLPWWILNHILLTNKIKKQSNKYIEVKLTQISFNDTQIPSEYVLTDL